MGQNLITKLRLKLVVIAMGVVALGFSPLPSNAKLEGGHLYSYERRIWNEAFNSGSDIAYWADVTLEHFLKELNKLGAVGGEDGIVSVKEILEYKGKVDKIVGALNGYMSEYRSGANDGWQWADAAPDALVIYGGPSVVKSFGFGTSFAVRIGGLFVPQIVKKIRNDTGEVVETYPDFEFSWIGWPQLGIAMGAGAGASKQFGVALLWNVNGNINSIDDVKTSMGVDFEVSVSAGMGISISGGALFDFNSVVSRAPHLVYLEGDWNTGPKVDATVRINGQILFGPNLANKFLKNFQTSLGNRFVFGGGGGPLPPGGGPNNPRLPPPPGGRQCPLGWVCPPGGQPPYPVGGQQSPGQYPPSGQPDPPTSDNYPYLGDKPPSRTSIRVNPREFYDNKNGN